MDRLCHKSNVCGVLLFRNTGLKENLMTIMNRSNALAVLITIIFLLLQPKIAMATWSITAVDPKTKQVGIVGASCTDSVYGIAGIAPGKGVIAAQAMSNMQAKSLGGEDAGGRRESAGSVSGDYRSGF